jgi:REP element-mobilizing transposase RayT
LTNYRRIKQPGGTYFFTLATFNRKPILTSPISRELLRNAWKKGQTKHPFESVAICLMLDHLHTIWRLPEGDVNFSIGVMRYRPKDRGRLAGIMPTQCHLIPGEWEELPLA